MCLEAGISIVCDDEIVVGGVKTLYLINKTAVTGFTLGTDHNYTAVSVSSTTAAYQWHKFEFQEDTCTANWEQAINDNKSKPVSTSIACTIPHQEKVKAKALQDAVNCCGLIAIAVTYSGESFVYGYDEKVENKGINAAVNGEVGATLDDNNAFLLRLEGSQRELPYQYAGTIVTTGGVVVTIA